MAKKRIFERRKRRSRNRRKTIYEQFVKALSKDYIHLYHVNLFTEQFTEYVQKKNNITVIRTGSHFFDESAKDALRVIHPDDISFFTEEFTKDKVSRAIRKDKTYSITYRLKSGDAYINASMKMSKIDKEYAIFGVSDITKQVVYQEKIRRMEEEAKTYSKLFSLADNYLCIYIINNDLSYEEYNHSKRYSFLNAPEHGKNFFEDSVRNSEALVYAEDYPELKKQFTKQNVVSHIKENGYFQYDYRMLVDSRIIYVSLKIMEVKDDETVQYVAGLSDVTWLVKAKDYYNKEISDANKKATIDALTNIRNKRAYVDMEEEIDIKIRNGENPTFAIAVFDVNDLKKVNDLSGHKAGDEYLISACKTICTIFKRSPVFRIGGDEFAAILTGHDLENSDILYQEVQAHNEKYRGTNIATIACGIAKRSDEQHVSDVFNVADRRMYINKEYLKGCQVRS